MVLTSVVVVICSGSHSDGGVNIGCGHSGIGVGCGGSDIGAI